MDGILDAYWIPQRDLASLRTQRIEKINDRGSL